MVHCQAKDLEPHPPLHSQAEALSDLSRSRGEALELARAIEEERERVARGQAAIAELEVVSKGLSGARGVQGLVGGLHR